MANFAEMNAVWDAAVAAGNTPARATVEAKLAAPDYKVEIMVVAAKIAMAAQPGFLRSLMIAAPGARQNLRRGFRRACPAERLAVPGFSFARWHQAISGSSGYFNFYLVELPDVLTSNHYLANVLDNPTPLTRKVMSEIFINMEQARCARMLRRGAFHGRFRAPLEFFNDAPAMYHNVGNAC